MVRNLLLLLTLSSCGTVAPLPYEGEQQRPDGCTYTDPLSRELFESACWNHDVCYRTGERTRRQCDLRFLEEMMSICGGVPPCSSLASLMYAAVTLNPRGDEVYQKRHRAERENELGR